MRRIIATIISPRGRPNIAPVSFGLTENDGSWHRKGALTYMFTLGSPRASFVKIILTRIYPTCTSLLRTLLGRGLINGNAGAPYARIYLYACNVNGAVRIYVFAKKKISLLPLVIEG